MKIKNIIIGALLLLPTAASAQITSPITRAMINVYDEILRENPREYEVLLRRGNEYYNHNLYHKAIEDVNNALRYIPADDKDTRFRALILRANTYNLAKRYPDALKDLNEALTISPGNYVVLYLRANTEYNLGQYDPAKLDYSAMLRQNPRSQDAMFGLAKIAVKQSNLGLANDWSNKAVDLSPALSDVYIRRAEVRELAGNVQGAVNDYILTISTDTENTPRALQELVRLSGTNYATVMAGLSDAIQKSPRTGMFYYIRAKIAQSHCHYRDAIADYDKIINEKLYSYGGLNASLAECYFDLCDFESAILNVDYAINSAKDNAEYYVLKSKIQRAMGQADQALASAETALEKNPNLNSGLQAKALAQISLEQYQDASVNLSEAVLNDPTDPYLLMLRGWVLTDFRKQEKTARTVYEQVLDLNFDLDDVRSLRGFALLYLGRDKEAIAWFDDVLKDGVDSDGMKNYYAACFYAQKGDLDKAFAHAEKSLENGYANRYNWTLNNDARINVAPLRGDARFKALMEKYAHIFK